MAAKRRRVIGDETNDSLSRLYNSFGGHNWSGTFPNNVSFGFPRDI
jgi:hypothetical protein